MPPEGQPSSGPPPSRGTWPTFIVFVRHQAGGVVATAIDFGTRSPSWNLAGLEPTWATAIAAFMGGVSSFVLSRLWVFKTSRGRQFHRGPAHQAARYALVSGVSLVLNTSGEYLCAERRRLPYVAARFRRRLVLRERVLEFFPMHRHFVFGERTGMTAARLRPFLPLPFVLWGVVQIARGNRVADHLLFFLPAIFAYGTPRMQRFFDGLLPVFFLGLVYDAMRFVQNVGLSPERVHVCDLRALDMRVASVEMNGVRTSVHDWLQAHATPTLDLYFAIPYGTFVYASVAFGIYADVKDYPALQRQGWTFLTVNLVGFVTYHLVPAAPPGTSTPTAARSRHGDAPQRRAQPRPRRRDARRPVFPPRSTADRATSSARCRRSCTSRIRCSRCSTAGASSAPRFASPRRSSSRRCASRPCTSIITGSSTCSSASRTPSLSIDAALETLARRWRARRAGRLAGHDTEGDDGAARRSDDVPSASL